MNLAIFGILWRLRRRSLPDGALFLVYLVLYAVGRFVITIWSAYQTVAWGLNQAQLISLVAFAAGLPSLIFLIRRNRPAKVVQTV